MNKKIIITISTLAIIIGIYFAISVGVKFFFNDYLYETPNLKNLTIDEAEALVNSDFKLVNMGEFYSNEKKGEIYSQLPEPPRHIKRTRPIKVWISKGIDTVKIPDLKNQNIQDAKVILNDLGIKVDKVSYATEGSKNNSVIGTDPQSETLIPRGSSISLLINVNRIENVRVPDILGYPLKDGENILRDKMLVLGDIHKVYRTDFPENTIIDINYPVGKDILAGSIINVTVSTKNKGE